MGKKTKTTINKKKNKDLSKLTAEEFLGQKFEHDMSSDDGEENGDINDRENGSSEQEDSDSCESDLDPAEHMKSLKKLKDTDPEFYDFLKKNDKNLLDFKMSDDEDDDDDFSINNDDMDIPDEKLEACVASDDSDYQPEEGGTEGSLKKKITIQLLKTWQQEIQTDKSTSTIKHAIDAFHAALESVAVSPDDSTLYKVEGGVAFNGVMELCVMYLPDALKRFLKLDSESHEAHKSKRFAKVRGILKLYLTDLIKLLQSVTSSSILMVLLKHLRQMLPYTQSFSSLTKPLLKILLELWSTGEETVRVVSFLNILRITTSHKESILEKLLKTMYVKYVQNSKFVSADTLPGINFMKNSLIEIYLFDHNLSYHHAFLYIRQLAIHLRNAVTLKKKENFQAVYNWQYINSLRLWTDLVNKTKANSALRSLLYPLVQIIIGTIKVIPTAQYYPLRFHCAQMLINISKETNVYIPVLPFLLELLETFDFNKKHKTVGLKPTPLIYILRLSKSQLEENTCRDNVLETVYQLILEYSANESNKMYFPDLYIPCIIHLKAFLKKCHVAAYCRKMKHLLGLIEENRKFILSKRSTIHLELHNMENATELENQVKVEGTAIAKFYASWIKIHEAQKLKLLNKKEDEFTVPVVRRKKQKLDKEGAEGSEEESECELRIKGAEDSEEESEFEFRIKGAEDTKEKTENSSSEIKTKPEKIKQKKKREKKKKKITDDAEDKQLQEEMPDIVQDINSDDWD
ncbi:Nucleolar complex protein 2-like protein [Ooceraea biroi]|uniref:Nucleolar complex protein 2-like protein n=1 Tax=Ooceraea biroi TaxID=2015173 RepID=A0A026WDG2_OOCBI|nr:Nucleolar complex protein 2-like protein [Ooceraea biroi]